MKNKKEINITTISIPKTLAGKIKERMEGTGFRSVSGYVTYILRQVVSGIGIEENKKEAFSKQDEEKVKERLRGLGYLD